MIRTSTAVAAAFAAVVTAIAVPLHAQAGDAVASRVLGSLADRPGGAPAADREPFATMADSLAWMESRDEAHGAPGTRLVISLHDRRLFWMDGPDTLYVAPIAVASGDTLSYGDQEWRFETPRGRHVIRAKEENPVWVPPLWHYVSYARETGRDLVELRAGEPYGLEDGSRVIVRDRQVGRLTPEGEFHPVAQGEQIVFDETLFVPPFGTVNREVPGELGDYKLDLGNRYLIHGTPHEDSIGQAATRGCIRLGDDDLAFLYRHIHVGTEVLVY